MTGAGPQRLLLGPQRPEPNLTAAVDELSLGDGPFACISAGWQEAEADLADVGALLGRPLEDLCLYQRAETVMHGHESLRRAYRERQDRLKEQQRLYRLRLKQLALAARSILRASGESDMLAAEQRHAIAQLRALDRHHLKRTSRIHAEFDGRFSVGDDPTLARHRSEIDEILERSAAVVITGGNVVVLQNRLRLFGLAQALERKPVVAWSAGAMVLASRIVLFHDRGPQGRRDAEVFGAGLGLTPGYIFLPDARHRLRERDHSRHALLARRFSPDVCIALDNGAALRLDGSSIEATEIVRRIDHDGRYSGLHAA